MVTCPNCNGQRFLPAIAPIWGREPCPSCHRTGLVSEGKRDWVKCPKCNGYGWTGRKGEPQQCQQCLEIGIISPDDRRKAPYRGLFESAREIGGIMGREETGRQ
jgi:DnaJ-class molecular chaperone